MKIGNKVELKWHGTINCQDCCHFIEYRLYITMLLDALVIGSKCIMDQASRLRVVEGSSQAEKPGGMG